MQNPVQLSLYLIKLHHNGMIYFGRHFPAFYKMFALDDLSPLLPSKTSLRQQCRCQELVETPEDVRDFCFTCVGAQHAIAVVTDNSSCSASAEMFLR